MSRGDTLKQKIERNIRYLFEISEPLASLYKDNIIIFYKIEGLCHRTISHNKPLYEINFDKEIEMLIDLINECPYNQHHKKALVDYHNHAVDTNRMIKLRYANRLHRHD